MRILRFKVEIIDSEYNLGFVIITARDMSEYGRRLTELEYLGYMIGRSKKLNEIESN